MEINSWQKCDEIWFLWVDKLWLLFLSSFTTTTSVSKSCACLNRTPAQQSNKLTHKLNCLSLFCLLKWKVNSWACSWADGGGKSVKCATLHCSNLLLTIIGEEIIEKSCRLLTETSHLTGKTLIMCLQVRLLHLKLECCEITWNFLRCVGWFPTSHGRLITIHYHNVLLVITRLQPVRGDTISSRPVYTEEIANKIDWKRATKSCRVFVWSRKNSKEPSPQLGSWNGTIKKNVASTINSSSSMALKWDEETCFKYQCDQFTLNSVAGALEMEKKKKVKLLYFSTSNEKTVEIIIVLKISPFNEFRV